MPTGESEANGMERKLTAILSADVAGYSRLMGSDEAGTHQGLKALRADFIDPTVAGHHGRIIKLMGDGALVEFASVVDALECAVAIQRGMAARNADVASERKIEFRIGINLGDVIVESEDIYGNGVNVAARLESLAEPGGICISGRVLDQVEKNVDVGFEYLGPQRVKNIEKPVNAYKVLLDESDAGRVIGVPSATVAPLRPRRIAVVAAAAILLVAGGGFVWSYYMGGFNGGRQATQSTASERHQRLSIAVLPFDNLSSDPEQEYFADAFTEDLITDLSRIRDAFVIARRTTFTYKDRAVDVATAARELGVRYILEGSVRRTGDQVRINAQLIDGASGHHIWSDRFDREVSEVFTAGSEVTGQIASALKAELRKADLDRQGPPESLEAWDYALRGNVLLVQPKRDFRRAKELLEKAIELDPTIASAWSGLAFVHFAASFGNIPGVTEPNSKDLSLQAAQRAVELDPNNAEGHWMVGVGYSRNGQTDRAWASCETAMDLNPNNDCAYVCAGLTKMAMGEPGDAVPFFERSLRLNPRFRTFTKYKFMGLAYIYGGSDEKAIEVLNRAITDSPDDPTANLALASALALTGREGDAKATLDRAIGLIGIERPTVEGLSEGLAWMGPGYERLLDGLRAAGLPAS